MRNAFLVLAVAASSAALLTETSTAAVLYWDMDGSTSVNSTTTGDNLGGTGSWSNSPLILNWWNGVSGSLSPWVEGNDAVFWGTAGTVTLSGTRMADTVTFKTDGYLLTTVLSNRLLHLTGAATITVDDGVEATIEARLKGTVGLNKDGAGTLIVKARSGAVLTEAAELTGAINITGGTLSIDHSARLNDSATGTITITGGSTFRNTNDGSANFVSASHGISLGAGGGILDVSNPAGDLTYAGSLSGSGGLTKEGPGALRLTGGNNTYSGGTIVSGGTLYANNASGSATGSGSVTIETGGTLAGTGAVAGPVTVQSGGKLSPGASIGTLTINHNLSFEAGSTFQYEINSSASLTAAADLVKVAGNSGMGVAGDLSLAGALNIVDLAGTGTLLALGTKFTLFAYAGDLSGTFDGHPDGDLVTVGANLFQIKYNDTSSGVNFDGSGFNNFVTITAVPEASAFLFGGLVCGLVGLAYAGRGLVRRRRTAN